MYFLFILDGVCEIAPRVRLVVMDAYVTTRSIHQSANANMGAELQRIFRSRFGHDTTLSSHYSRNHAHTPTETKTTEAQSINTLSSSCAGLISRWLPCSQHNKYPFLSIYPPPPPMTPWDIDAHPLPHSSLHVHLRLASAFQLPEDDITDNDLDGVFRHIDTCET